MTKFCYFNSGFDSMQTRQIVCNVSSGQRNTKQA